MVWIMMGRKQSVVIFKIQNLLFDDNEAQFSPSTELQRTKIKAHAVYQWLNQLGKYIRNNKIGSSFKLS